jgi:hypothetical protein
MSRFLNFVLLFLIISSCTLSAKQEQALNKSLALYVKSIEEENPLVQVSYTHPDFVAYINSKGDKYFKTIFSPKPEEIDVQFINPILKKVEKENNNLHVLFEIKKEFIYKGENKSKNCYLVAISENKGKNWFFVDLKMYRNKKICKKLKRLLK